MDRDRVLDVPYATDCSLLDSPSTLVAASELMYEPSEATTLYERDLFDTSSVYVVKPAETENFRRNSYAFNERWSADTVREKSEGNWRGGIDQYPNKESSPPATPSSSRSLRKILSSFIGLFTGYKARKQLSAINSRVEHCRRNYHPLGVKELQTAYEYLHELWVWSMIKSSGPSDSFIL